MKGTTPRPFEHDFRTGLPFERTRKYRRFTNSVFDLVTSSSACGSGKTVSNTEDDTAVLPSKTKFTHVNLSKTIDILHSLCESRYGKSRPAHFDAHPTYAALRTSHLLTYPYSP